MWARNTINLLYRLAMAICYAGRMTIPFEYECGHCFAEDRIMDNIIVPDDGQMPAAAAAGEAGFYANKDKTAASGNRVGRGGKG